MSIIAFALLSIHFGIPVAYYAMLRRFVKRRVAPHEVISYPKIAIVIPTYNEAGLIEWKLDDVYKQDYPRDKMEVIIVDSASIDGTIDRAFEWHYRHPDLRLRIIQEPIRRGKAHALNAALKMLENDVDIIVITDVDSKWLDSNTLKKAVAYLLNPSIGAVSCVKSPIGESKGVEGVYRDFYNVLRIAESNAYSTPIFHGEFAAFKRELLEAIGGFPTDIGADDSHAATKVALMGYRAIVTDDIVCEELLPIKSYIQWRVRRAQHLIQHFIKSLRLLRKAPREFKPILLIEAYLHVFNPWILLGGLASYLASIALNPCLIMTIPLIIGLAFLSYPPFRTWVVMQFILMIASLRNLRTRELSWRKEAKALLSIFL